MSPFLNLLEVLFVEFDSFERKSVFFNVERTILLNQYLE